MLNQRSSRQGKVAIDKGAWSNGLSDKPSAARIYDYLLGGFHNFAIDRAIVDSMLQVQPDLRLGAQANRAFLRRAVRFLVGQGVEQFLDLGSGIPTVGNVHQVAQAINPRVRVVYVDIDPIAVRHSLSLLDGNDRASALLADIRQPDAILASPEVAGLLDLRRPLGLLAVSVLHYVSDDGKAYEAMAILRDALAAGSYVCVAHSSSDANVSEREKLKGLFGKASQAISRPRVQIERFFEGLELVKPGLVYAPLWRPESPEDLLLDEPWRAFTLAGVARKG